MKTHQWIPPVVMQTEIGPAESPAGTTRTNPRGRTASRILILALVLGGFGAGAAAASGQVSAHHTAGNARPGVSAHLTSAGHVFSNPWAL